MSGGGLPSLSPAPDWMAEAACAEADPELFYPTHSATTRIAKRICAVCPVQAECLAHALAIDERFGIWGGQAPRSRRRLIAGQPRRPDPRLGRIRALVAAGRSNTEIAALLGCSDRTVGRICQAAGIPSNRRPGRSRVGAS